MATFTIQTCSTISKEEVFIKLKIKVKFNLEKATKAQRVRRGITSLPL